MSHNNGIVTRALKSYGLAFGCVGLSALCAYLLHPRGHVADWAMIHLLGIVFLSLRSTVRVSVLASLVSIALFDYLFITPNFAFALSDVESWFTFSAMIIVAIVVSTLSQNLRRQERAARAAAFRAEALYALNVELTSARDDRQLAAVTARHLRKLFNAQVSILLVGPDGVLETAKTPAEAALAQAAWLRRDFTSDRAGAKTSIWVPIIGAHSTLGAIGLEVAEAFDKESDEGILLTACSNQFATAVERVQLSGAVRRTQLEAEAERLRSSLLSAVSHDLKTPLATMIAAGSTLLARRGEISAQAADDLLASMVSEGERLSRLIHNLLSVTRLESQSVELRRTPESLEDIVLSALDRLTVRGGASRIQAELPDDLPLISAEPLLLEQVLLNLLENATRYAGANANIQLGAHTVGDMVVVQVSDDGPGIPEHERDKVFEKFYRGERTPKADGGVGLGLTICRAIVRAHGGRISIQASPRGGTTVEFTVPIAKISATALPESALLQ